MVFGFNEARMQHRFYISIFKYMAKNGNINNVQSSKNFDKPLPENLPFKANSPCSYDSAKNRDYR
jgi:hypothetical protein